MVNVLLFASLREAAGANQLELELALPATVAELKKAAAQSNSEISRLYEQNTLNVAVNLNISEDEQVIHEGDEIAIFPPVTGG